MLNICRRHFVYRLLVSASKKQKLIDDGCRHDYDHVDDRCRKAFRGGFYPCRGKMGR